MTEIVENEAKSFVSPTSTSENHLLEDFLKGALHAAVEQPVNEIISGINALAGDCLPKLNITGIQDIPHKPVNYIKAKN